MQSVRLRDQWEEEKLRYRTLRAIYDRTMGRFDQVVTGPELKRFLDVKYEDLFRVVHFLEHHAFLRYLGAGPRVSLTEKGLHYIEEEAGKRRSLRLDDTLQRGPKH
jgi:hypothetical protein